MDDTIQTYLHRLEDLPFIERAQWISMRAPTPVSAIHLLVDGKRIPVPVVLLRTHLTRELAERFVHMAKERRGLLILAPAVGRNLGERFEREGVNFMDLAGNCHVRIGDRYVALVQGRRAAKVTGPTDKALRPPAYRVLFTLLVERAALSATARELATLAGGVSPQTANSLRHRLVATGELVAVRDGMRWAPGGYGRAVDTFVAGFRTLAPSLRVGRFRMKDIDPVKTERALAPLLDKLGDWRWGGGAASRRLTGHYRGDYTLAYLADADRRRLQALRLLPDTNGPVILAAAPSPCAFNSPNEESVHPLLVYADLLVEGHERAREAAAEVHRMYLEEPPG